MVVWPRCPRPPKNHLAKKTLRDPFHHTIRHSSVLRPSLRGIFCKVGPGEAGGIANRQLSCNRCLRNKRPSEPYAFIGLGAMEVTKPYKFIWLGDIHGSKSYKFIGCRWAFISQTSVLYNLLAGTEGACRSLRLPSISPWSLP